jgi:hypothetical protein
VSRAELIENAFSLGQVPGKRKAVAVAAFADGAAESPGESISRAAIHLLGFPPPVLQQEFRDSRGLMGVVDFWWPEYNLIGEFDGRGKYLRDEFTAGKDAGEMVINEKQRENRLRATRTHPNFARWEWTTAMSLPRLRALLLASGLPQSSRPR